MTELLLVTPDGHPLRGGYPVVSCNTCGCGFADVLVPGEYYDRYYAELAKYGGENAGGAADVTVEPGWLAAKSDASADRIAGLAPPGARVLDLGCASGSLLAALRRRGYDQVFGIDPSPESVRRSRELNGVHVDVGTFAKLPEGLGTFDCVCLTGVLEHLWDVDAACNVLHDLVRPGGAVYVEVPDAACYLNPYVAPFEDFSTEHVNHFSVACLEALGARFGLATAAVESVMADIAPGVSTAVASAAWRRDKEAFQSRLTPDASLKGLLDAYAQRSILDFHRISAELEHGLDNSLQYILWGIGETAFKLLALDPLRSRSPIAYVDSNPARHGFRFQGIPVTAPEALVSSDIPIVVSSLIRADSIVSAVAMSGLANPVVRLDTWTHEMARG